MLSEDEKRRYDRQVRVWGAKSQLRIQNSKVFLAGFVGLNVEVAKNLVLAGVNVSLQDTRVVSAEMLSNNFFITEDDIGKSVVAASLPRLQNLNPFAQISTMQCPIDDLDDQYLSEYDVILLSDVYEVLLFVCVVLVYIYFSYLHLLYVCISLFFVLEHCLAS